MPLSQGSDTHDTFPKDPQTFADPAPTPGLGAPLGLEITYQPVKTPRTPQKQRVEGGGLGWPNTPSLSADSGGRGHISDTCGLATLRRREQG